MRTKNFTNIAAMLFVPSQSDNIKGLVPVIDVNGTTGYIATKCFVGGDSYPSVVYSDLSVKKTGYGISVGYGTTPETENDYNLEHQITSGISGSAFVSSDVDASGNPELNYDISVKNTSSSVIIVSEVGYKQRVYLTSALYGTSQSAKTVLFDRTLLESPVTIQPEEIAIIRYTLKAKLS